MASRGVRVSTPPQDAPQIRRRPRQSRAQASAQALQDAFVRVLLERGYEKTTIREVAAVAGVGVGTFYEYFGNMRGRPPSMPRAGGRWRGCWTRSLTCRWAR